MPIPNTYTNLFLVLGQPFTCKSIKLLPSTNIIPKGVFQINIDGQLTCKNFPFETDTDFTVYEYVDEQFTVLKSVKSLKITPLYQKALSSSELDGDVLWLSKSNQEVIFTYTAPDP